MRGMVLAGKQPHRMTKKLHETAFRCCFGNGIDESLRKKLTERDPPFSLFLGCFTRVGLTSFKLPDRALEATSQYKPDMTRGGHRFF